MDLQKPLNDGAMRELEHAIHYLEQAEGCLWNISREDGERLQQIRFDVQDAIAYETERRGN